MLAGIVAQTSAEVVICGAGIAGIATAYHLAVRRGMRGVLLVDERPPLSLTSDKSAECYRNWWRGPGARPPLRGDGTRGGHARLRSGAAARDGDERLRARRLGRIRLAADRLGRDHRVGPHPAPLLLPRPGSPGPRPRPALRMVQRSAARHVPARARARAWCPAPRGPGGAHRHGGRTRVRRRHTRGGWSPDHRDLTRGAGGG